jgi:hypothetical protein
MYNNVRELVIEIVVDEFGVEFNGFWKLNLKI